MEDPLRLREELSQLKKDILNSKKIKEDLENHIDRLHNEEIRYLEEIPIYKKQAEYARDNTAKLELNNIPLKRELENVISELKKVRELVVKEENALSECKKNQSRISKDISDSCVQLNKRTSDIYTRELAISNREIECESRELFHKKIENDLDKREVEIVNKERALEHGHSELDSMLKIHDSNKSTHAENVRSLIEQRKFLEEDKRITKDKLEKATKLVKEHCELKAQLLLQADKSSQAIKKSEDKQIMLDKALNELQHQENTLRIKELKIRKMAHEAGLQKELKELEESLK